MSYIIEIYEDEFMYEYIFFDLDGTLTESGPGIVNSVEYALKKMGYEVIDRALLNRFVGPPLLDSFMRFFNMSREQAEQGITYYREYFTKKGMFENSVYDGVKDTLDALKSAGKILAVATSKPEKFAVRIIEYFELAHYFDKVCGATLDASRITKADVIQYAIESSQLKNEDKSTVLMVGDRKHDILGAKQHGIASMGVLYGYGDREELEKAKADYIISVPGEMLNYL